MPEAGALVLALLQQSLLLTSWILLIALLRQRMGLSFGASSRLALWSLVPVGLLATLLPCPDWLHALSPGAHSLAALDLGQTMSDPGVGMGVSVGGNAEDAAALNPALGMPLMTSMNAAMRTIMATVTSAVMGPAAEAAVMVWALGALLCSGLLATRQRRYRRQLHWDDSAQLWRGPAGSSPAAAGLWRPQLVLPSDFAQRYPPAEQTLVLAHEACHHAHRDNLWRLLGLAVAVCHWFNPLVWWALAALRQDQELACDAAVLRQHPSARPAYLQALLKSHVSHPLPGAMSAWAWGASPHPVIERVQMLPLHRMAPTRRRLGLGLVTSLSLLGASLTLAATTPPPATKVASPPSTLLNVSMDVLINGLPAGSPKLMVSTGQSIEFGIKPSPKAVGAETWRIGLRVEPGEKGKLKVFTELASGTPPRDRGQPQILVAPGQPADFSVSDKAGKQVLLVRNLTLTWAPAPAR